MAQPCQVRSMTAVPRRTPSGPTSEQRWRAKSLPSRKCRGSPERRRTLSSALVGKDRGTVPSDFHPKAEDLERRTRHSLYLYSVSAPPTSQWRRWEPRPPPQRHPWRRGVTTGSIRGTASHRAASTRWWFLRARTSSSPSAVSAGAPDQAAEVGVPWPKPPALFHSVEGAPNIPARSAGPAASSNFPVFCLQGMVNASEKMVVLFTGRGDEAQKVGVSNLLLSPRKLDRWVGVSGLTISPRTIIRLLVAWLAQLFIRLMACSFTVLVPVSSAQPEILPQ
jgi:hypothetical protein